MGRLITLALIFTLVSIQLSSTECKKNGNKNKRGCKFNGKPLKEGQNIGDILQPSEKKAYDDMCVELVCNKVKRKPKPPPKERMNGGGGGSKGKGKAKYHLVAKAKEGCNATQCQATECPTICTEEYSPVCGSDGKTYSNKCKLTVASCQNPSGNIEVDYEGECRPCGGRVVNGRCIQPLPDETDSCKDEDSACPAEWECKVEKFSDPKTGCTKCRCNTNDRQYEDFCRPIANLCPMDCGVIEFIDEKTGCLNCKCDPDDQDNPFAPPDIISVGPSRSPSWKSPDGCNTCSCMNGMAACTEMACIEENVTEKPWICTNGCSKEMVKVCGSDSVTYENSCKLDFERLCNGKNVTLRHPGPCHPKMKCNPCHKRKYQPVCGDDCKTYSNACVLDFENCQHGKNVKKVMEGSCEGDKNRSMGRPKRDIHRRQKKILELLVKKRNEGNKGIKGNNGNQANKGIKGNNGNQANKGNKGNKENKGKGGKGKCPFNGRKLGKNKFKDLGIHCTRLKCIKKGRSTKLEIQAKPNCQC